MTAITHTSVLGVLSSGHGPWTVREIAETLRGGAPAEHYFYDVLRRLDRLIKDGAVKRFDRSGPNGAHCYAMVKGGEE